MAVDFSRQPPALGADIPRVRTDGRPTDATIDIEQAQRNWFDRTVVDLDTRLTQVRDDYDGSSASFEEQISALAEADQAIIQSQTTFEAQVGQDLASVEQQVGAAVDATSALAADITTLSTTLDGQTAELEILAASVDGLSVQYSITGTIDGSTGGLIISGARTITGGAAFGISFAASAFTLTDPNLPSGAQQVFSYSTELGAFTFNIPLKITGNLIAPGAIAEADYRKLPNDTLFINGAGFLQNYPVSGYDMPLRFEQEMILDLEAQSSIYGFGHNGAQAIVRCDAIAIALVRASDGAILKLVQVGSPTIVGNGVVTSLATSRFRQEVAANTDYVIRFLFSYFSNNSFGAFYFKEASIYYTATIRKT